MDVGNHTSHIPSGIRFRRFVLAFIDEFSSRFIPMGVISFIHRIYLHYSSDHVGGSVQYNTMQYRFGFFWDSNILMGEHECSNRWIERKSMHTFAPRQHQLRRAPVHAVPCRSQFVPRLQDISHPKSMRSINMIHASIDLRPSTLMFLFINRKNGTGGDIAINV